MATDLAPWADSFDIAFSYEVIYLLPDLAGHARGMFDALRDGGVYYAVTGCHTENPLWPRWREVIGAASNAPVQDHAPQDFIDAFAAAGFAVSVKRFGYDGFIPATKDRSYYPSIVDAIDLRLRPQAAVPAREARLRARWSAERVTFTIPRGQGCGRSRRCWLWNPGTRVAMVSPAGPACRPGDAVACAAAGLIWERDGDDARPP